MNFFKKAFPIILAAITLSACGFVEIKTDKNIVKPDEESTTTSNVTLEVPTVTSELENTTPPVISDDPAIPDEPQSPFPMEMMTTANVNARKEPSTAGEIVEIVSEGTKVKAVGYSDGWYEIELDGAQVFIIENYLEEISEPSEE